MSLGGHELLELHEQAAGHTRARGAGRRAPSAFDAVRRHVALAQRRHAEVDERVAQRAGAEAAAGNVEAFRCLDRGLLCLDHSGHQRRKPCCSLARIGPNFGLALFPPPLRASGTSAPPLVSQAMATSQISDIPAITFTPSANGSSAATATLPLPLPVSHEPSTPRGPGTSGERASGGCSWARTWLP